MHPCDRCEEENCAVCPGGNPCIGCDHYEKDCTGQCCQDDPNYKEVPNEKDS